MGIIGILPHRFPAESKAVWIYACGRISVSAQQRFHKTFLVNSQHDRFPYRRIRCDLAFIIHGAEKDPAGGCAAECILIVVKKRIAGIRHTVSRIDLAGLQRHGQRITVGNSAHSNPVNLRFAIPVIFVFYQFQTGICLQRYRLVRPRTDDDSFLADSGVHIDDTTIGIGQIIDQRRHRFLRPDRQSLSIRCNLRYMQIAGCPLMIRCQRVQTFLYRLSIHGTSIGKCHAIPQRNHPGQLIRILIVGGQPGFDFHGI